MDLFSFGIDILMHIFCNSIVAENFDDYVDRAVDLGLEREQRWYNGDQDDSLLDSLMDDSKKNIALS